MKMYHGDRGGRGPSTKFSMGNPVMTCHCRLPVKGAAWYCSNLLLTVDGMFVMKVKVEDLKGLLQGLPVSLQYGTYATVLGWKVIHRCLHGLRILQEGPEYHILVIYWSGVGMKGHTQQTQQRGLLFTIHHEFQGKTKFSHNFRHQMHMPGGTNHPWATFLLGKGPLGQLSPWAKGHPGKGPPGKGPRAKGPRAWVGASSCGGV